jgi:hypothetical protein
MLLPAFWQQVRNAWNVNKKKKEAGIAPILD